MIKSFKELHSQLLEMAYQKFIGELYNENTRQKIHNYLQHYLNTSFIHSRWLSKEHKDLDQQYIVHVFWTEKDVVNNKISLALEPVNV